MNSHEMYDWVRLIRDRQWTDLEKHKLIARFGSAKNIYAQSESQSANKLASTKRLDSADLEPDFRWLEADDQFLIPIDSPLYPQHLREIYDPPIALFAKGQLSVLSEPKIAIVGSRRPTPIGKKVAEVISRDLSQLGIVVTSGMALGIDGVAHHSALLSKSPTIAVMGCGLDIVYPQRNRDLAKRISELGLALSEYPIGVPPRKQNFPKRNRIVSGLSLGVVIIEAAERSGTLITARLACEQNRELMVVPGVAISPQYAGSHGLIQNGANLVCNSTDILRCVGLELGTSIEKSTQANIEQYDEAEDTQIAFLRLIGHESTSLNTIISESGLTSAKVSSMLLMLELDGAIAVAQDGGYVRLS
jgi:DNA processing protein